jgi:RNA polymerase sigma factor (sigma-70 family)
MPMPEPNEMVSDRELVLLFRNEATRAGAFTRLVRQYQQRLYWHIRRMVVTHEDTDDILQNVFIKVWRNLEGFREESALYTWLYRIATNETLSWMEVKKRFAATSMSGNEDYFAERIPAQRDFDPSRIEWKLQQAIATLPDKQRIVFNLRYYDEMPYDDMAEVLSTSEGALKASYHHAVKKVEEYLKQH